MKIFVYVCDALRADFLSCYGAPAGASPCIDALAADGIVFENAFSTSSWTKPAAASLLSGMYPRRLRMFGAMDVLAPTVPLLQEDLGRRKLRTYAFSANAFVSNVFGFTRGFDYDCNLEIEQKGMPNRKAEVIPEVIAARLGFRDRITTIIQSEDLNDSFWRTVNLGEDFLALFWSVDTHDPYFVRGPVSRYGNALSDFVPTAEVDSRRYRSRPGREKLKRLYRDMVWHNDAQIGDLVARLKGEGAYDDALFILVADHGEAFGEHGDNGHGRIVYGERIRIPLIVKLPHGQSRGQRVGINVSLCDIYPTVLDVIGEPMAAHGDGVSLLQILREPEMWLERAILVENCHGQPQEYSGALIRGRSKYLRVERYESWRARLRRVLQEPWLTPREQQFDRDADPHDLRRQRVVDASLRDDFDRLRRDLDGSAVQGSSGPPEADPRDDERVRRRLEELGYL